MSIEFPLAYKLTPFGFVRAPRIPVILRTPTGHRTFEFLLDTGADFSIAPRSLAGLLDLDWDTLPSAELVGSGRGRYGRAWERCRSACRTAT